MTTTRTEGRQEGGGGARSAVRQGGQARSGIQGKVGGRVFSGCSVWGGQELMGGGC